MLILVSQAILNLDRLIYIVASRHLFQTLSQVSQLLINEKSD